jgi:hypothetical protein
MPSTKPLERRPARRQRPWSATSRNAGYFLAGAHRVSRNVVVRQRLCPRGPAPRSLMPSHGRRAPCRPLGLGVDLSFCGQPVGDGIPAFEIAARSPQIGTLRNLSVPSFLFSLVGGRIAHRWIFHGGLLPANLVHIPAPIFTASSRRIYVGVTTCFGPPGSNRGRRGARPKGILWHLLRGSFELSFPGRASGSNLW